jgi:hypothetical protein
MGSDDPPRLLAVAAPRTDLAVAAAISTVLGVQSPCCRKCANTWCGGVVV